MTVPGGMTPRKLSQLLNEAGLTLPARARKHWLTLTPQTIQRKIKKLKSPAPQEEAAMPSAMKAESKTGSKTESKAGLKLLSLIDGATSKQSYRVIAVKGEHMISIRAFSQQRIKIKFYPNVRAWNLSKSVVRDTELESWLQRNGSAIHLVYDRVLVSAVGLHSLVQLLSTMQTRSLMVASQENIDRIVAGLSPVSDSLARFERPKPAPPEPAELPELKKSPPVKTPVKKAQILPSRPKHPGGVSFEYPVDE